MADAVSTVRRICECWARGDFAGALSSFAEDLVYVVRPTIPDPGTWNGRAGLMEYTRDFLASWEHVRIEAEELQPAGDRVLVRVRQVGTGRASGVQTEMRYFQVFEVRSGSVVRLEVTRDEGEARRAAGLAAGG